MKTMLGTDASMKLVLCDCGKLHVTCGPVTLHFTRDEFMMYAESVRRLAAMIVQSPVGVAPKGAQSASMEMCH